MRSLALIALAVAGLSLAACDSQERTELKEGAAAAGAEV